MSNKSPAFQFYPGDFLSDRNTLLMTADEIGMYVLLMCVCWKEGYLEDDLEEMAVLSRANGKDFEESWNKRISKCFKKVDGKWIHPRLEKEREKQESYKKKKVEAGKKGAEKRWGNSDSDSEMADNSSANDRNGTAITDPMAEDSSSSSTSTSSSNNIDYVSFVDWWNKCNDAQCRITEKKRKQIRSRLETYSKEELFLAIEKRSMDAWINGEGIEYKKKWNTFWRNDEKPENYLQKSTNNGVKDGGTW